MKRILLHLKCLFFSIVFMAFVFFFFGTAVAWITYGDDSIASFSLRLIFVIFAFGSGILAYWAFYVLYPDFET